VQVAVRLVGPVRPERREVAWMLPRLLPTEAATHQFKLLPTGYGRIELHARLVLPVGGEASVPALRCRPLAISMARMLRVPRGLVPGPHGFFEAWGGLPVSAELPVVATWPGVDGLLLALSALGRQPLRCAWRRALPAVCGAQAAYLTAPAAAPNETLALVVTLQLMPPPAWTGAAPAGGDDADDAGADDARSARDSNAGGKGAAKGTGKGDAKAKPAPAAAGGVPAAVEAARRLCGEMCVVGHIQLRSSSHEVVLAVRDHAAAWVQDLAQGTLALGLTSPLMAASDKPLLHPSVACLKRVFEAAPLAAPLPEQVKEPELPPVPKLQRRCALGSGHVCAACPAAGSWSGRDRLARPHWPGPSLPLPTQAPPCCPPPSPPPSQAEGEEAGRGQRRRGRGAAPQRGGEGGAAQAACQAPRGVPQGGDGRRRQPGAAFEQQLGLSRPEPRVAVHADAHLTLPPPSTDQAEAPRRAGGARRGGAAALGDGRVAAAVVRAVVRAGSGPV
jgi:hypothetical protein